MRMTLVKPTKRFRGWVKFNWMLTKRTKRELFGMLESRSVEIAILKDQLRIANNEISQLRTKADL
jgi:hypothetical protein